MADPWLETTLGAIADINPESTPKWGAERQIRYVDIASVARDTGINLESVGRYAFPDAPGRARRRIRANDVLVSTVRPNLRAFAVVPEDLDGEVASTGFAVLRAKPGALPGFIWCLVQSESFVTEMVSRCTGSNYPAVRADDVAAFPVSLPPIPVQRRIVDLMAHLDNHLANLRAEQAAALALLDALREERLDTAGGAPRALADVTMKIGSGATPRGGETSYVSSGTSLIRSQNVYDDLFEWDGLAHITEEQARLLDGVEVLPSDVLINITGASVNRCCIVPEAALPARVNQHVAILRADATLVLPTFLMHSLRSRGVKGLLDRLSGSGTTRQALTKAQLASLEVPVPDLEAQRTAVAPLLALREVCESLAVEIQAFANFRADALQAVLSGELHLGDNYDALLTEVA